MLCAAPNFVGHQCALGSLTGFMLPRPQVCTLSYVTAFMEALTISGFSCYQFADRHMAWVYGSAFYGSLFSSLVFSALYGSRPALLPPLPIIYVSCASSSSRPCHEHASAAIRSKQASGCPFCAALTENAAPNHLPWACARQHLLHRVVPYVSTDRRGGDRRRAGVFSAERRLGACVVFFPGKVPERGQAGNNLDAAAILFRFRRCCGEPGLGISTTPTTSHFRHVPLSSPFPPPIFPPPSHPCRRNLGEAHEPACMNTTEARPAPLHPPAPTSRPGCGNTLRRPWPCYYCSTSCASR